MWCIARVTCLVYLISSLVSDKVISILSRSFLTLKSPSLAFSFSWDQLYSARVVYCHSEYVA